MKTLTAEQKLARAEYSRKWRTTNPDKAAKHAKDSRIKNKEKVAIRQKDWAIKNKEKRSKSSKEWYLNKKERVRDLFLQRTFGITLTEYNSMLSAQNNACAICGNGPDATGKSFAVDHCHKTGRVRALLCRGCNVGIGNLKDDPDLLIKAAEYIIRNRGT